MINSNVTVVNGIKCAQGFEKDHRVYQINLSKEEGIWRVSWLPLYARPYQKPMVLYFKTKKDANSFINLVDAEKSFAIEHLFLTQRKNVNINGESVKIHYKK